MDHLSGDAKIYDPRRPLPPEEWLRETLRRYRRADRIAAVMASILLVGIGTALLADALIWDARVRSWRQVPGVMLKNDRVKVRSGSSTITVSQIEYEYRFAGRRYTGRRILYGGNHFPASVKPGTPRKILVNPIAPAESAAMIRYRGHWGLLRYAGPTACFATLAIALAVIAAADRRRQRLAVPAKLRDYAAAHSAAAPSPPFRIEWRSIGRPPEAVGEGIFRARDRWLPWAVFATMLVGGTLATAAFCRDPLLYFLTIVFLAVFWAARPGSLTLEPRRRRMFTGGLLRREREFSLADVQMLVLSPAGKAQYRLDTFRRDGAGFRLFRVPERSLPQLLEVLPEIAEELGSLPIGFSPGGDACSCGRREQVGSARNSL